MTNDVITDNTPIAMLTIGQLKEIVAHQCAAVNPTLVQPSDRAIVNSQTA